MTTECSTFWGMSPRSNEWGLFAPSFLFMEVNGLFQFLKAKKSMIRPDECMMGEKVVKIPKLTVAKMKEIIRVTEDRKSTRLNSSHVKISYAVFCLKKKKR